MERGKYAVVQEDSLNKYSNEATEASVRAGQVRPTYPAGEESRAVRRLTVHMSHGPGRLSKQ